MTSNKELQEKRMRGYFIEATKETLKGEGLKAVNVRSVSEKAGYSFATLYNYFKDMNELIFMCVQDFMNECEAFINERSKKSESGPESLKVRMKAYIQYFTQYPGIFELFYIEPMNDIASRQPTARMIYEFTDRIVNSDLTFMLKTGEINADTAERIKLNLRNSIAGLLLLYNNRMQPPDYPELMALVDKQIGISVDMTS